MLRTNQHVKFSILLSVLFAWRNIKHAMIEPSPGRQDTENHGFEVEITTNKNFVMYNQQENLNNNRKNFGGVWSRVFPAIPERKKTLCFEPESELGSHKINIEKPTQRGLFYLKLFKVGSSTSCGVHVRIARNLARRQTPPNNWEICRSRHRHGRARSALFRYGERFVNESFLWATLRYPTSRYVSEFFHFHVSRKHVTPSLSNIKKFLPVRKNNPHYMERLTTNYNATYKERSKLADANNIIQDYDFLAITERTDESFVVLSMILGIPLGDVLHLDSKRSGGYDDGAYRNTCFFIVPTKLTPEIQEYLDSPEWQNYIAPELALYQAANHSLDLTIDRLGRDLVEQQVKVFRYAQRKAQEVCGNRTRFPCTADGVRRNPEDVDCLFEDFGCGLPCLDDVAQSLGIDK